MRGSKWITRKELRPSLRSSSIRCCRNVPHRSVRAEAAPTALVPIDDLDDVDGPDGSRLRSGVRRRLFVLGVFSGRVGNDFEVVNDNAHGCLPVEYRTVDSEEIGFTDCSRVRGRQSLLPGDRAGYRSGCRSRGGSGRRRRSGRAYGQIDRSRVMDGAWVVDAVLGGDVFPVALRADLPGELLKGRPVRVFGPRGRLFWPLSTSPSRLPGTEIAP